MRVRYIFTCSAPVYNFINNPLCYYLPDQYPSSLTDSMIFWFSRSRVFCFFNAFFLPRVLWMATKKILLIRKHQPEKEKRTVCSRKQKIQQREPVCRTHLT